MLILLIEVVYWAYGPFGGHRSMKCVGALAGLHDVWFHHLFGGCCEYNLGGKDIISDGLSWVRIEFLVCGGVG